jgi:hypothetical protein
MKLEMVVLPKNCEALIILLAIGTVKAIDFIRALNNFYPYFPYLLTYLG